MAHDRDRSTMRGWTVRDRLLRPVALVGTTVLLAAGAAACGQRGGETGTEADVIKIAAPIDLSGVGGSYGSSYVKALKFAVKKINDAGGIQSMGGAKLELIVADSKGDPQQTVQLIRQMKGQGAKLAAGPIDSPSALAVKPTLISLDMVLVTNASEASLLENNQQTFYRWGTTGTKMTQYALDFIKEAVDANKIQMASIGTISQANSIGPTVNEAVKEYGKKENWKVTELSYDPQQTQDFGPLIAKLRAANVDLVTGYALGGASVAVQKAIAAQSWRPKNGFIWVGGAPTTVANFQEQAGAVSKNQFVWGFALPKTSCEAGNALSEEFKAENGADLTGTDIGAMAAIQIIDATLEKTRSTAKKDIAALLHSGQPLTKFCEGLYMLPGEARFSEGGNNDGYAGLIFQQDGEGGKTAVWPKEAAAGEANWPGSDR